MDRGVDLDWKERVLFPGTHRSMGQAFQNHQDSNHEIICRGSVDHHHSERSQDHTFWGLASQD
jgi:hypothetical protein